MKSRTFNPYMKSVTHAWAARVLGMQVNPGVGPDLIDDARNLGVEIKFGVTPYNWTVMEPQMDYNNGRTCFWGLGLHRFNRPISSIRTTLPERLESYVEHREFYIVAWDWMKQFPSHVCQGQTELSSWRYLLRYPKPILPATILTVPVDKGNLHFTDGVNPRIFGFK